MRKRLMLPALFTACTPMPNTMDAGGVCEVVRVADAGRLLYGCADGRTCTDPSPSTPDSYQLCPGQNECEIVVAEDGGMMNGLC
jgi:hypothetical protein